MPFGTRCFVAEDQPMIALAIRDLLSDLRVEMVGPGTTLEQALHLANTEIFDTAIIDASLSGKPSYPIGDLLARRKTPFVVMSAGDVRNDPESFRQAPRLPKPFTREELLGALTLLIPSIR